MSSGRWVNVKFLAASICLLAGGLSCPSGTVQTESLPPQGSEELVVFFTGSELGSLRPCGCSGGQLGGLEKRSAVLNSVAASRRLIVGTGALVEGDREQDQMKFRILFEAFKLLNYDVVHLTGRDIEIATRLGLLSDTKQPFDVMHAAENGQSVVFTRRVTVGGRDITVNIVSFDSPSSFIRPPPFALGPQDPLTVNILILDYSGSRSLLNGYPNELLLRSWQSRGVECVICPSSSDESQVLNETDHMPLVCTVGRFGRYVLRLGVKIGPADGRRRTEDSLKAEVSRSGSSNFKHQTSNIRLRFESIPLRAELPDDEALVQLYRQYQQLVAQSSVLESYPRVPLPQKLAFAGSASCKPCHEPQYDKWSTTAHSHALTALKKVGSDRDPECVVCHVLGLQYEGGFVNEAKTPHLGGVGCENCHGAGSDHVLTSGQTPMGQPKTACTRCHTPEQSGEFAGHEEEYMKNILHWREPAAPGNVKN